MRSSDGAVLVTGASSGLGLECAKSLSGRGFKVYGAARSFPTSPEPHKDGFLAVAMDVRSESSIATALEAVARHQGSTRIAALLNNAGYGLAGSVEDCSIEEAQSLFDTNFFGAIRVSQAVLPQMREAKAGLIVNVCSLASRIPLPFQGVYSASKAALAALSESMAAELSPFGVKVAIVEPGDFASDFTSKRSASKGAGEGSPYKESFDTLIKGAARREAEGMAAAKVAETVCAIVEGRRHGFKYLVGSPSEKLAAHLKPYIPKKAFDKMLERHYKA